MFSTVTGVELSAAPVVGGVAVHIAVSFSVRVAGVPTKKTKDEHQASLTTYK
jgi:hypothetical protein